VSEEINPYEGPAKREPINRSDWTHAYVQKSLDLGEVGLAIQPEELIIDVVKTNRRVRIPRRRHFEPLHVFRTFTRLKVSPPISLTLPPEILAAVRAWRGGSTPEWLQFDLRAGTKWLWIAAFFFGIIFFGEFETGQGGFVVLNPLAAAMVGLAFFLTLLRAAFSAAIAHRLWFLVDVAPCLLIVLYFVFGQRSRWWFLWVLFLFIPVMIGSLRRYHLHRRET